MSTEDTKKVVADFFDHLSKNDVNAAVSLLSNDAKVDTMTKERFTELLRSGGGEYRGLNLPPQSIIADGDHAVVIANSDALQLADGTPVAKIHHSFHIDMEGDKIKSLRDYTQIENLGGIVPWPKWPPR